MGLFSRKSKSKKDVANDIQQKAIETQPKKTPAKFVPRHQRAAGAAAQSSRPNTHDGFRETVSSPPSPSSQRAAMSMAHGEDNYYHDVPAVPSFKNRSNAYGKHQITADYYVPHNNSSDSGYESAEPLSAIHSRVPSELNLHDHSRAFMAHNGTLPELRLDGESNTLGMEISGHGRSVDNVSPLDLNSDTRSIKSNRSISKRTRFEDDAEPMPPLDQIEQHRKDSDPATSSLPALGPQHDQAPVRHANADHADCQPGPTQDASMPPLCILDGLKVNKKGKILDEEGDPIGELVDGDLLDCVRQKVNANGEVLDEYGRIVGRVRTCASVTGPVDAVPQQIATETQRTIIRESEESPATAQSQATMPSTNGTAQLEAPKVVEPSQDGPINEPVDQLFTEPAVVQLAAVAQAPTSTQDAKRMSRSASEKSLSELSKPYARPTMSSVPENNVPEDDTAPASPGMFSYKGDIPVVDGPAPSKRRSKSPPHPAQLLTPAQILPGQPPGPSHYAKLALVGGHSNNTLYPPMRPMSATSRRSTTQLMGGPVPVQRLHPVLKKTMSNGYGFDPTPNGSDAGSDPSSSDDGRMLTMGHSRTGSVNTTATVSRSRTYFTHAGKVTVDPDATAATKPAPPAAPVAIEKKKKTRMSMSFGRKSKVAA